jgi:hypothetical protein
VCRADAAESYASQGGCPVTLGGWHVSSPNSPNLMLLTEATAGLRGTKDGFITGSWVALQVVLREHGV